MPLSTVGLADIHATRETQFETPHNPLAVVTGMVVIYVLPHGNLRDMR